METNYKGHANKSGVYQIRNLINSKVYIGSAKSFKKRQYQHLSSLRNNIHQNDHLQASFNKYGSDSFIFEVLEVVTGDKLARTTIEQQYFDNYLNTDSWDQVYNIRKETIQKDNSVKLSSALKGKKHSKETKEKMSVAALNRSDEYKENLSVATKKAWQNPEVIQKHSESSKKLWQGTEYRAKVRKNGWDNPDYRNKISIAMTGENNHFYGKKHSAETLKKISQNNSQTDHNIYHFIHKSGIEEKCKRIELINKYNLDGGHLAKVINGIKNYKYHKGWKLVNVL